MKQSTSQEKFPYKRLGDKLLERLGNDRSLTALADPLKVSVSAIYLWFTGKCRPRVRRLGYLAAMLDCSEVDLAELTELAGYDVDEHNEAVEAFCEWPRVYAQHELARRVDRNLFNWASEQLENDKDFCQEFQMWLCERKPDLYAEVKTAWGW